MWEYHAGRFAAGGADTPFQQIHPYPIHAVVRRTAAFGRRWYSHLHLFPMPMYEHAQRAEEVLLR